MDNYQLNCPDCGTGLDQKNQCQDCGWTEKHIAHGVYNYLASEMANSLSFKEYQGNYDIIAKEDLNKSMQSPFYLSGQSKKIYNYSKNYLKKSSVLEVGVGQGSLLKIFINDPEVVKYCAVDISLDYLQALPENSKLTKMLANAEALPFIECFDFAVATDILEHVLNVGDFLVSANRSLKMNGIFVVRVPLSENLLNYSKIKGCPYDYVHLRTFNKDLLNSTLEGAGFKVVSNHYDGYIQSFKNKMFSKGNGELIADKILNTLYPDSNDIVHINNLVGKFLMKPFEIVAVCKKVEQL